MSNLNWTEEKRKQFEELAKPLMQWINNNSHPHTTVIITPTTAELSEGSIAFQTEEFIKD